MRILPLLIVLLLVTACNGSPTGPSAPLNAEFVLAPGQSTSIEGASLTIRFNGVSGDSRCPADAFCVQGGDAIVRITVTSTSGPREYQLHTGNMQPVQDHDVTIALVQLAPYPFSTRTIGPDEYRATLRVTR